MSIIQQTIFKFIKPRMFILKRKYIQITALNNYCTAHNQTFQNSSNTFTFKSNFTNEQEKKILNTLNKCNPEELSHFNISQTRIKNFENWKTKNGSFKSLNEVLEVDGLGEKVLEKICASIVIDNAQQPSEPSPKQKRLNKSQKWRQIITPTLNERETIKSAVSIHLGSTGLSWAKILRKDNKLEVWNYCNFISLPIKLTANETFDLAVDIVNKIPSGDLYVFEANQSGPTTKLTSSYLQQLELSSMLLALINTSKTHNLQPQEDKKICNRVYYLRSKIPARLFRTLIGNEKVSAITSVTELINDKKHSALPCTKVFVEDQLRSVYNLESPANKELMGQALMLIVSFMDLCVYKTSQSFDAITPGRNNNSSK